MVPSFPHHPLAAAQQSCRAGTAEWASLPYRRALAGRKAGETPSPTIPWPPSAVDNPRTTTTAPTLLDTVFGDDLMAAPVPMSVGACQTFPVPLHTAVANATAPQNRAPLCFIAPVGPRPDLSRRGSLAAIGCCEDIDASTSQRRMPRPRQRLPRSPARAGEQARDSAQRRRIQKPPTPSPPPRIP